MKFILTTTALVLCTTSAMAQGFTGGSVGLSYSGFTDQDDTDGNTTKFDANAQFAITNEISVAADLTVRDFEGAGEPITGFTLHGIYHVSPDVSLGLFGANESGDLVSNDIETYGAEIAYTSGPIETQAFIGVSTVDDDEATLFGVAGSYGFGNGFAVTSGFNSVNDDDISFSKIEIGAEYALGNGAEFYASLGNTEIDFLGSTNDANFFRVGAEFNFGPDGGTTFDRRSVFDAFGIFGL